MKKLSEKKDYKVGRIFSHETCEFISLDLDGSPVRNNPYTEHLLITKIVGDVIHYLCMEDGSKSKTKIEYACYFFKYEPNM